eukprot:4081376-Pleurochrysis_carterae.AAC.1
MAGGARHVDLNSWSGIMDLSINEVLATEKGDQYFESLSRRQFVSVQQVAGSKRLMDNQLGCKIRALFHFVMLYLDRFRGLAHRKATGINHCGKFGGCSGTSAQTHVHKNIKE